MRRMAVLLMLVVTACGGDDGDDGDGDTPTEATLVIRGSTFIPGNLSVRPGMTVRVKNEDAMTHSVTSQATAGAFTPGGVSGVSFDTGVFGAGERTFVIPASAAVGTVIPYYCATHTSTMANAGQLTVAASTGGGGGGGGDYDPYP
jgi:plastocyanin